MNKIIFRLTDVGGHRTQRSLWRNLYDDAAAIIFLVSLSDYDQALEDDAKENCLVHAVGLFQVDKSCNLLFTYLVS